jgi:YgiT-type zinc finger domain-containing protein
MDRLESEDEEMKAAMKRIELCPLCGGSLETRQVEKILSGGGNTATLNVTAEICSRCGEQLYTQDTVLSFEKIRAKLLNQEFTNLKSVGQSFTVEDDWPITAIRPFN